MTNYHLRIKSYAPLSLGSSNIWHRRNTFIFKNLFASPQQVLLVAKSQLETFQTASLHEDKDIPQPSHTVVAKKWEGPEEPFVRANWDAALNTSTNSTGLGSIVRDSNGNALVSICRIAINLTLSILAKTMTL